MPCELITPGMKAGAHHLHSSRQATTRQCGIHRPPTLSRMSTLSGGKTKTVPPTGSTVQTLTLVSGPRPGTPKPTTSTTQRTSKRAQTVLSFIVAPQNLIHPLQQLLTPSPHYPHTHGGHHPLVHPKRITVAVPSSTWLRFPDGDAVSGWPGLGAPMPSSRWILIILIVLLWSE